jgi:hypothetical protein
MLDDSMSLDERMTVLAGHAYWLVVGGRLPQGLEEMDHIADLTAGDPQAGGELLGYSPLLFAHCIAAYALAQMGRFDECWQRSDLAIRLAREEGARENLGWALGGLAFCGHLARGASRAPVADVLRAVLESVEIAEATGSQYSKLAAANNLAMAFCVTADYAECDDRFDHAFAQTRAAGTALEWQGFHLSVRADALLARGNAAAAIASAREAIAAADASGAWFQAAVARAALADALVHANAPEAEVAAVIAEARELVHRSSGDSLRPRLREAGVRLLSRAAPALLEAGLREVGAMYRAMGAPDPAHRLAQEMGGAGNRCEE